MSGITPARKTKYVERSWLSMVLEADTNFYPESNKVLEYDFRPQGHVFEGWYQTRGPYSD